LAIVPTDSNSLNTSRRFQLSGLIWPIGNIKYVSLIAGYAILSGFPTRDFNIPPLFSGGRNHRKAGWLIMYKRLLGILSIGLLIFAFMFSSMTQSGYCMGDNIIRAIGFKAWSMESAQRSVSGFHYTVLFSLTFAILGYLAAKHYLKEIYPKLVKHLPLIVIILFITSTQLVTGGYQAVLSFSEGINAVDYIPAQSNCNYFSNSPNDLISYSYQITLKNYSNDKVKFNMQVQKPSRDSLTMWDVTATDAEGKQTPTEFTLQPREQKGIRFMMEDQNSQYSNLNGSMHRPNIIIFDKDSRREFKVH
jgi:hypothetical protein